MRALVKHIEPCFKNHKKPKCLLQCGERDEEHIFGLYGDLDSDQHVDDGI